MTETSQPQAAEGAADRAAEPATRGETDQMIRALVVAEKRSAKRHAFPELEPPVEAPVGRRARAAGPGRRGLRPALPGLRHVVLCAGLVFLLVYPLVAAAVMLLPLCTGIVVYLTLGPDRSAETLAALWEILARRRPALARSLQQHGDALALKYDALLDRVPGRWADALARRDLARAPRCHPPDAGPDPFDRLRQPAEGRRG